MFDILAVAMLVIVPTLMWSICQVRRHQRYALHKKVQVSLGGVLLAVVTLFEVDVRINGWKHLAEASRFYDTVLFPVLYVHLFFSISTALLWIWTILFALRYFDRNPVPNTYSPRHRRLARLAALFTCCTAVTGWTFYVLAFLG